MKKLSVFLVFFWILISKEKLLSQTPIVSSIFSQNYWEPNRHFGGQLETYWSAIQASGVKYMRIGGISYDANSGTHYCWSGVDLASGSGSIIAEMQTYGIIPIIQVPIDINQSISTNATNAANLVNSVNNTYGRNVTYWEIGNEPNGQYGGTSYNYDQDATIRSYIQQVSTAMKGVSGQSGIKIIGPSFSYYDYTRYHNFLGGTYDITGSGANGYYIDYIDFHSYPFQTECYWQTGDAYCNTGSTAPTRTDVVNYLTTSYQYNDILGDIVSHIPTGRTSSLHISVSEINLSTEQNRNDKSIIGFGPGSFLGGQYWAEMFGISMDKGVQFVCPWSAIEGTGTNNYLTDIGYISSEYSAKRSTYWHYYLLANNFSGTYYHNVATGTSSTHKALVCTTATEVHVLIMNQDLQSPRGGDNSQVSFKIDFNGGTPTGATMIFGFAASNTVIGTSGVYSCSMQKESTMYLSFNKSTGALLTCKTYSLQDAMRPSDTGPNSYVGGTETVNTQSLYNSYPSSNVYTDTYIGVSTGITASTDNTFLYTNSANLTGPYSCPVGQSLSIRPSAGCQ